RVPIAAEELVGKETSKAAPSEGAVLPSNCLERPKATGRLPNPEYAELSGGTTRTRAGAVLRDSQGRGCNCSSPGRTSKETPLLKRMAPADPPTVTREDSFSWART